ncbi:DUF1450 domain-containing protein [Tumebacillus lipolyticus]|uniref:DUF1450 domain-containing protein n=1 Tax=Tumebacillus lipolyticus TaxID=1280370 RepID=A0ABW4ZZK7_9BACL
MGEDQRIRLDFCNGNLMSFTQELFLKLREEHPEWIVSRYGCLTNCGECAARPFAFVMDELVAGDDLQEFEEKLRACLAKKTLT